MKGRVLIIAGSDSGGGAGIQADIKTVTALGGYAATAVTAITVQDTTGVHAVHPVPPEVIAEQIRVVLDDIGADAIKIGMIGAMPAAEAILNAIDAHPQVPVVLDPVLVATSGDRLGDGDVAGFIRTEFVPRATVLTPNAPELGILTGRKIEDTQDLREAAFALIDAGANAVLAKGGHLDTDPVEDGLTRPGRVWQPLFHPRQMSRNTHGTGCTLASGLATGIAQGLGLFDAARRATDYVAAAIEHAPGLGQGHGPLNHALVETDQGFRAR